jgi:hypothetical protein
MAGSVRETRAARNEDAFRQLNDRLRVLSDIDGSSGPLDQFVCECAQTSCSLVVQLTPAEYRAVRATSTHFLVFPESSHTSPDLETVVARRERYWVVEKRGEAGAVAEELADGERGL